MPKGVKRYSRFSQGCFKNISMGFKDVSRIFLRVLSNSSPKSKVQTSVLGLGVDFVFPLSQQHGNMASGKGVCTLHIFRQIY